MKKSYLKVVLREIKQSFGRFAAIFAITLLGVGFLYGLISTTPMMHHSVTNYYNDNNFMDINIKSTLGFNEEDIESINSQEGVDNLTEAYSMDALVEMGGEVLGARIYGIPLDDFQVNRLTILEGRLPQDSSEVVVERESFFLVEANIGDSISISDENEDLEDRFTQTDFEVVGIVENSAYFQKQAEMTQVGNGRLGTIMYGTYDIFDMDVFTDIFITVEGARDIDTFSEEYFTTNIEPLLEDLEEIGEERSEIRFQEIQGEAEDEIEEARAEAIEEIEEAMSEAEEEIQTKGLEAEEEIEKERRDAEAEIVRERAQGLDEIERARIDVNNEIEQARREAEEELERQSSQARNEIERNRLAGQEEIERNRIAGENEIERNRAEAEEEIAESLELIEEGIITDSETIAQIQEVQEQIEAGAQEAREELNAQIEVAQEELDAQIQEAYAEADAQIAQGQTQIDSEINQAQEEANREIQAARANLDSQIEEAQAQLDSEIQNAQEQLEEEIENAYIELDQEIEEAYEEMEAEIQEAEEELADLDEGEWFVLDRNTNASYVTFDLNSAKIDAVATVFPIFFYLVAALVSLTTMTRMVEEDRMQIGTLKALGYSKITIISKYIIYSGLASLLGSIAGLIIGTILLPVVIWNAFDSLFHLPEFQTLFNTDIALISSGIAILGTILVTIYVCNHILRENAASLMQPKAPKPGKRILLERIGFFWSRLSFSQKSTIRNVFRYKKHFFMTVIGISGCMALLLTGFGLRDSISDLASIQFNEIIVFNMEITFEDDAEDISDIRDILDREEIEGTLELHMDNGNIRHGSRTEDLSIIAVDDIRDLEGFRNLRDRESASKLKVDNDSAVITEKIAEYDDINIGQVISIENFNEVRGEVEVTHITENYVANSIYITKDKYNEIFNRTAKDNTIYVQLEDDLDSGTKDDIINELLSLDNVLSANLIADNRDTFDNLLSNINYIVVVIIIASGGLAFIVLYNLTNININERKKELATFRVLGFYNEEVAAYIFRETAILTTIGILVGLGLGTILHQFVIITVEDPDFMFGRDIRLLSYGLSALITIAFAIIVNIFMSKKIRDIKMADSMKAND